MSAVYDFLLANPILVGLVVGVIAPPLTAVVNQPTWTKRKRTLASAAVSVVLGFGTAVAAGAVVPGGEFVATVIAVIAAAEVAYKRLWQPVGATSAIELRTSKDSAYTEVVPGLTEPAVVPDEGDQK